MILNNHNYETKLAAWILFVYERMSAASVAKQLGIPAGSVTRWGYEGRWVSQRSNPPEPRPPMPEIPPILVTKTPIMPPDKAIAVPVTVVEDDPEEPNKEVVEKWQSLAEEHEKAYSELRKSAQANIRSFTRKLAKLQAQRDTDTLEAIALSLPVAKAIGEWGKLLDLATKGERTVTSAHYHDLNNAIALIRKYGYDVVAPLPIDQPDETDSAENAPGISTETSDRILRETLGVESDSLGIPEELGT